MGFASLRAGTNPEPAAETKSCDHRGLYSFRDLDAMSYRYCEGCGATSVLVQDAHDGKFMLVQVPEYGVEKWDEVELAPTHDGESGGDDDQVSDEEAEAIARLAEAQAQPEAQLQPQEDQEQEHLNEFEHPDGGAGAGVEQALPGVPAYPAEEPVPPRPQRRRRKVSDMSGVQAPQKRRTDAEAAS